MIAGLNKKIRIYMDDQELDTFHMLKEDHADEISCMDFHQKDQILVSSSYNGDIYVWSIERAIVTMTFNMYQSIMPMNRISTKKNPKITLIHRKKSIYHSKYSKYANYSMFQALTSLSNESTNKSFLEYTVLHTLHHHD